MELSINQLSELTGKDRRTITNRVSDLESRQGPKGALLFDAKSALEAIYVQDSDEISLDRARTRQALSQERLNDTKNESLRRERIPLDFVLSIHNQSLQAVAATLKAAKGKKLAPKLINELLRKFRAIPSKIKW